MQADSKAGGSSEAIVFVVDGSADILNLFRDTLRSDGLETRLFQSGLTALRGLDAELPDLIILDVGMPEADGYGLCKAFKLDPRTRDVPVMVVSAVDEPGEIERAFDAGAIDYLTKPFRIAEARARVRAHLRTGSCERSLRDELGLLSDALRRLEEVDRERLEWLQVVAHDFRAPLSDARGRLEVALRHPETASRDVATAQRSLTMLTQLVEELADATCLESGTPSMLVEELDVVELLRRTVRNFVGLPGAERVRVEGPRTVLACEPYLVGRVVENLVTNALQYDRSGGPVVVGVRPRGAGCTITVTDRGPGLPTAVLQSLASPPALASRAGLGESGLGLWLAQLATAAHDGAISAEPRPGGGTTLRVDIPGRGLPAAVDLTQAGESAPDAGSP